MFKVYDDLRTSPIPDEAPVIKTTFLDMFSSPWKLERTVIMSSQRNNKGEIRSKSNKKT
ncbi:hypothetical protein HanRHA438_Chr17g0798661 [Helianthus annuus]|nr:hypothetical protein HanRHA438_Chr17g0798661 [Helianthus annuus]